MLGILILSVLLGIFIVLRAYMHPMKPFEYMLTLILLICLLGCIIMRPFPIYPSILPVRFTMEPFTQVLAKLDTTMLSDVVQLPNTVRTQVSNGMNYLIQVQKNIAKSGGSKKPKDNYQEITKETLEAPNMSNEEFQQIGMAYIYMDEMLSALEANYEDIYKSITGNIKVVDPYDVVKQEFGLDEVVQEEVVQEEEN